MVLHEVHPLGDVIITLYNPNAPFAVDKPDQATTLPNGSELPPDDVPKVATDVDDQKEDAAHIDSLPKFRVSSAHLILASGYFRRMLTGPWIESLADDGIKQAKAHDWDEDVFLALMNIIHGRNRKVSRIVGLDFLAKFAAMVDYYKCHEAVELWSSCFWQQWKHTAVLYFQHNDRRNLTLRLLISWVFSDSPTFSALTQHVLWHSTKPLQTFELPIPAVIIDEIEKQRQKLIGEFMECMNAVIVKLRDSDDCSFECSSMMLGALIKGLGSQDIPFPLPTAPYLGYSLSSLKTSTAGFKRLEWSNKNHKCSPPPSSKVNSGLHGTNTISSGHFSSNTFSTNSFGSSFGNSSLGNQVNSVKQEAAKDKCDCNLASLIVPTMDKIERRILGWPVEDFPKSSEEDQ